MIYHLSWAPAAFARYGALHNDSSHGTRAELVSPSVFRQASSLYQWLWGCSVSCLLLDGIRLVGTRRWLLLSCRSQVTWSIKLSSSCCTVSVPSLCPFRASVNMKSTDFCVKFPALLAVTVSLVGVACFDLGQMAHFTSVEASVDHHADQGD